jgi:1,4-alpha-glucan branching enzyme
MRKGKKPKDTAVIICNFTPVVYEDYRIGVPYNCSYTELFNSDWQEFGGSDQKNEGTLSADKKKWQNQKYSIEIKVPPLAVVYFKPVNPPEKEAAEEEQTELELIKD